MEAMRSSTLATLGLGSVLDLFRRGRLPAEPGPLVDRIFGEAGDRGAMVVSGCNGIVGAGKMMQFGARLEPFGVPLVGLDFPGAPDGLSRQYAGLVRAFGPENASRIMGNMVRLSYDGRHLPEQLVALRPRFLLEAIPEILEVKRAHYALFRESFPEIEIRSVTSGFPASQLGVGIAHPAFPHEVNKVFEVVEPEPSDLTRLFWALGLLPIPVSDHWSFVLDVLFCGVTLAALRAGQETNLPVWKLDKYVRKHLGPNPLRAHDAIGTKGASFLTWSCLHHLQAEYGALFTPTRDLVGRKESGQSWYPPDHFRPLVDWKLAADEEDALRDLVLAPVVQMTSLMLAEERAHPAHLNAIGELCAQFRRGILALLRELGPEAAIRLVERHHARHPELAGSAWHPEALAHMETPEWRQLYVNAEHDGKVGVVTISRESYNRDVDAELGRALDWLRAAGIGRVILTSDFHLSTQMVGADTSEFFPALDDEEEGVRIAASWSRTARRLAEEFEVSVGFVPGKRCLGGFLELMVHCHALVCLDDTQLGLPEVTLPVVPGMEGCHWTFRKCPPSAWPRLLELALTGRAVRGRDAVGWLVDFAGPMEEALAMTWRIASGDGDHPALRPFERGALADIAAQLPALPPAGSPGAEAARAAILATIRAACAVPVEEALEVQARHSAGFMRTSACRSGRVGEERSRTLV
jgi:enoyl-CoA hydratase/carnithine racemase/3-hydroxyacyl-CoA dehydrogenase